MRIGVYYEEHQGLDDICLVPMKMVARFPRGKMRWDKSVVYFPIDAPFDRIQAIDFNDDLMSLTIVFEDLITNIGRPNQFGVFLPRVIERMDKMKERDYFDFDYNDVEQFIIHVDDIEELLKMDVRTFYKWRE